MGSAVPVSLGVPGLLLPDVTVVGVGRASWYLMYQTIHWSYLLLRAVKVSAVKDLCHEFKWTS